MESTKEEVYVSPANTTQPVSTVSFARKAFIDLLEFPDTTKIRAGLADATPSDPLAFAIRMEPCETKAMSQVIAFVSLVMQVRIAPNVPEGFISTQNVLLVHAAWLEP